MHIHFHPKKIIFFYPPMHAMFNSLFSTEDVFLRCFLFQAESSGKSQMVIEKMVEGRIRKYYEEVVLLEQKYFLNDSIGVKVYIRHRLLVVSV